MEPPNNSTRQVFISHDTQDSQFARRLGNDLQRLGMQVWIAPESFRPGEEQGDAINRGLRESSHILVVLTPAAVESQRVKMETNAAIAPNHQGRMQVIPLDVKPCQVPLELGGYQMISFRQGYDAALSRLANILGACDEVPESARPAIVEPRLPFEPEMILIPAGEFLMGSDPDHDKDAYHYEQPQHTVYLPDYYLARTPVTNAQYAAFVEAAGFKQPRGWENGKPPTDKEDHPVVWVSCYDALAYCSWLAETTNKPYRLPSEAEWEKGARGTDGRIYPWGDRWDAQWSNSGESGQGGTTPVGIYHSGASPYGLLDMAGNVWEWTQSLWGKDWETPNFSYPYKPDDGRESLETDENIFRILRGGAFLSLQKFVRCAYRARYNLYYRLNLFGFRLAAPPDF